MSKVLTIMTTKKSSNIQFVNFTQHEVVLNDGRKFPSFGNARVSAKFTDPIDDICDVVYGNIEGLPAPQDGVLYIVSGMVLAAAKAAGRTDCVAPATGHPATIRTADKKGIISVPCFIH